MARPTDLTPEAQKTICKSLRNGDPKEVSALLAGVTPKTVYNWLARGRREKDGPFFQFLLAVEAAETKTASKFAGVVKKAAFGHQEITTKRTEMPDGSVKEETMTKWVYDVGAAQWWLERRQGEFWGPARDEIAEIKAILKELRQKKVK